MTNNKRYSHREENGREVKEETKIELAKLMINKVETKRNHDYRTGRQMTNNNTLTEKITYERFKDRQRQPRSQ